MTKPISKMSDDEFRDFALNQMLQGWVPLKMYLKLVPDETKVGVESRVARGHWQRGVHYNAPVGGGAWVNLIAIRKWASGEK